MRIIPEQAFPASPDAPARGVSVLIVDDECGVRELMMRWLVAAGLNVQTAASADEALGLVEGAGAPAVVLCDIRMPGHDGLWLAERIRRRCPETAVIMATGVQEIGPAVESLRQGVVDYLTKPFGRDRLREAVQRGLEWHRTAWDARKWRETLEEELETRRTRLADAIAALKIDSYDAVDAMLSMLTLCDRDAYAHAHRVAQLAVGLGAAMGVGGHELETLEHAALLHDVGKLAMPEAILRKPAPLTLEERLLVRRHPQIAGDLMAAVPFLAEAAAIVRDVHERVDRRGYPRGVGLEEVALASRILAVVDTYDTVTRPRVFRDALPAPEALLELDRCKGSQFDADVVDAFQRMLNAEC